MSNWPALFAEHRHLVLQGTLQEPLRSVSYQYVIKRALHSRELSRASQTAGTPAFYADPLGETLLELFLGTAESFSGLRLDPTFSELRVHSRSMKLDPHRDRDACEVQLLIVLGYDGDSPWPLLLRGDDGIEEIELAPGDGLLYRPAQDEHWRDALDADHHALLYLSYVDRDGPHRGLRFDGRVEVGEGPRNGGD